MNLIKVNTIPSIFNRMDTMFDGFLNNHNYNQAWSPKYDVIENEKDYVILMEVPGIDKKDLKIEVEQDTLIIGSENKDNKSVTYYEEFCDISFTKSFYLPEDVESSKINAELKNGILEVKIPRNIPVKVKPKKITIK